MNLFGHKHDHFVIGAQPDKDERYGLYTLALWRCECGDVLVERLAGAWTLDELKGKP